MRMVVNNNTSGQQFDIVNTIELALVLCLQSHTIYIKHCGEPCQYQFNERWYCAQSHTVYIKHCREPYQCQFNCEQQYMCYIGLTNSTMHCISFACVISEWPTVHALYLICMCYIGLTSSTMHCISFACCSFNPCLSLALRAFCYFVFYR